MGRWLLLVYRLPRTPSAPRVAVWRALKRLHGAYVQDGVFALPFSALNEDVLADLAHDVRNYGGEATIATSTVDDERALRRGLREGKVPAPPKPRKPRVAGRRSRRGRRR
ncbi:MAG: Chromate resistance protein ChrB [Thermoplasmatota archaeon]